MRPRTAHTEYVILFTTTATTQGSIQGNQALWEECLGRIFMTYVVSIFFSSNCILILKRLAGTHTHAIYLTDA